MQRELRPPSERERSQHDAVSLEAAQFLTRERTLSPSRSLQSKKKCLVSQKTAGSHNYSYHTLRTRSTARFDTRYAAQSAQRSSAWARTVLTADSWRSGG